MGGAPYRLLGSYTLRLYTVCRYCSHKGCGCTCCRYLHHHHNFSRDELTRLTAGLGLEAIDLHLDLEDLEEGPSTQPTAEELFQAMLQAANPYEVSVLRGGTRASSI